LRSQYFQNGGAIFSSQAGTYLVYGAVGAEYSSARFETDANGNWVGSVLGAPTSDVMDVPGVAGARMNTFEGGVIYWSPDTGAHVLYGAINDEYNAVGGPAGFGLPTSDEADVPSMAGVRVTYFQNGGAIYSSSSGAYAVYGAIGAEYAATINEMDGGLGAPTGEEQDVPGVAGARMQTFQNGAIYWSPNTNGAHAVFGPFFDYYNSIGGPSSYLGLPVADIDYTGGPSPDGGTWYVATQTFQNGYIYKDEMGSIADSVTGQFGTNQ